MVAFRAHNEITFYTWGDEQCCLPAGATCATLRDGSVAADRLRLMEGDVVIFEQVIDPITALEADADPTVRHAVRLTKVTPAASSAITGGQPDRIATASPDTDALPIGGVNQPIVEVEWDERDALPFPLCISAEINGQLHTDLAVLRGNVLMADHGELASEPELLAVPESTSPYRPALRERDVTYAEPFPVTAPPAADSLVQDVTKTLPALELHETETVVWQPAQDLLNSDRFARDFVLEPSDDRLATLRFGDGTKGRQPVPDTVLSALYRVGNGELGNVGAESIAHIVAADAAGHGLIADRVIALRNPMPATGGTNPEDANRVRLYAPEAFRVQERAVTELDYAEVTERRRDIQKAAGTRRWTGSWHTMFVTVDRFRGLDVDDRFEADLVSYLDRYRLAAQDVEIDGPRFVPLDIELRVCALAGYFRTDVKRAVLDTFSSSPLADGTAGYFHADNFTFGDTLYLSSLVSTAMAITGVHWIDVTRFHRWGEEPNNELSAAKIDFGRLEIPLVDNDPNAPENGRLVVNMEGGK